MLENAEDSKGHGSSSPFVILSWLNMMRRETLCGLSSKTPARESVGSGGALAHSAVGPWMLRGWSRGSAGDVSHSQVGEATPAQRPVKLYF